MLGKRIRYYRNRKNLTQEQLAQGICSVSYLSKFENGNSDASEDIIRHLCHRLDISYETVDNQEDIEKTKELLDDWYQEIKKKKLESAQEQQESLKEKVKSLEVPEVSLRYDLFKMRFLLASRKIEETKPLMELIYQLKEHFTKELEYYFYNFVGIYHFAINDLHTSLNYQKEAEKITNEIPLKDTTIAELYYQLGLLNSHLYLISSSLQYTYKALSIFDKDYNLERSSDCHILLGIGNHRIRNYEQSEFHYQSVLKLTNSTGNQHTKKIIYNNLGYLNSSQGKSENAIEFYKKSLNISHKFIKARFLIAKEYYKLEDAQKTKEWIQPGIKLSQEQMDKDYSFHFKILQLRVTNTFTVEYEMLLKNKAIPYFKEKHKWDHVAEYTEYLADYYFSNSQYKNAGLYYQQTIQARKKLN